MAKKRASGFGARLRELRTKAGLTIGDLAERASMHIQGLTKLEHGDREPAWATVMDLARALGVSCEVFADCVDVPGEQPAGKPGRPRKGSGNLPEPIPSPPPAPAKAAARPATGRTAKGEGEGTAGKGKGRGKK